MWAAFSRSVDATQPEVLRKEKLQRFLENQWKPAEMQFFLKDHYIYFTKRGKVWHLIQENIIK